jgi:hypothetical protein
MVWEVLANVLRDCPPPVTWNAVPFQPLGADGKNAPLDARDIELGRPWLETILQLFPRAIPVAVGKRATLALQAIGAMPYEVRHPSRGGKARFADGIGRIAAELRESQ